MAVNDEIADPANQKKSANSKERRVRRSSPFNA